MAHKIRITQEEEIVRILKKEGFREVLSTEFQQEPFKSMLALPDCFTLPELKSNSKNAKQ